MQGRVPWPNPKICDASHLLWLVVAKRTKDPTIAETLSMQAGELLAGRKTSKQAPLLCPAIGAIGHTISLASERNMLKLRGSPDLDRKARLVRLEDRTYATWQAAVDGKDQTVTVLIETEAVAGKTMLTERISAALKTHREMIEQLANAAYKPSDETVFVTRDQLTLEIDNAMRAAP